MPIHEIGILFYSPEMVLTLVKSPQESLGSEGLCSNKQEFSKVHEFAASHDSRGNWSGAIALTVLCCQTPNSSNSRGFSIKVSPVSRLIGSTEGRKHFQASILWGGLLLFLNFNGCSVYFTLAL